MSPSPCPALFVCGTDTGVGKTLVASALAGTLARRGMRVGVMKPVETGCAPKPTATLDGQGDAGALDEEGVRSLETLRRIAGPPPAGALSSVPPEALAPADALLLIQRSGCDAPLDRVNPYRYAPPLAPAVAARLAQRPIDPARILGCLDQLRASFDFVVVEGAGGLMVPLTDELLLVDLLARSGLPALLVGRSALGTINHTLLSLEALERRRTPLAGVVLSRSARRPDPAEAANPLEIERYGGELIRGILPYFSDEELRDDEHLLERFRFHVDVDAILAASS